MIESLKEKVMDKWNEMGLKTKLIGAAIIVIIIVAIDDFNYGFLVTKQSSVDNIMNFGLGKISNIDSLIVVWYYGKRRVLTNISVNQTVVISENEAQKPEHKEEQNNNK